MTNARGKDLRVIIAGAGEVGLRTADILKERGHDPVLIERDTARCEIVADESTATLIEGDATLPGILEQADPQDADALAALTDNVSANLTICMMGQQLNADLHTVLRTDASTGNAHAPLVGAVVYPERASARLAVNAVLSGDVRSLEHAMGSLDIAEVRVAAGAPAEGRTLEAVQFPAGSLVVSDAEGDRIARPNTVLQAGQRYIVAAESDVMEEVMQLLRG